MHEHKELDNVPRRSFFSKCLAALLGLGALAAPTVAGIAVLLDPLRKKTRGEAGDWIRVASLSQVPADGKPYFFKVVADEPRDKWNRYGPQAVGAVYLLRSSEDATPAALSSVCPHLGCTFDYDAVHDQFLCPCHNGKFHTDGKQAQGSTVSPRDLDPLEVRVDASTGDVEVNYKRFKGGIATREVV
jgi:menaquinol-cytochrome c reductase iron-sulfur subunit